MNDTDRVKMYKVCIFPSCRPPYYGEPWVTDWWWVARLWVWWRGLDAGVVEVRVVDKSTGVHYVY